MDVSLMLNKKARGSDESHRAFAYGTERMQGLIPPQDGSTDIRVRASP